MRGIDTKYQGGNDNGKQISLGMNTKYQGGNDNGKQIRSRKRKSHLGSLGRKDNLIIKENFHADLQADRRVLRTYANSSFMT